MGAPGTDRWIAAHAAQRARLRRESMDRALRRFVIAALCCIPLLLLAPKAWGAAVQSCEAFGRPLFVVAFVCFALAGFLMGAIALMYLVSRAGRDPS